MSSIRQQHRKEKMKAITEPKLLDIISTIEHLANTQSILERETSRYTGAFDPIILRAKANTMQQQLNALFQQIATIESGE